MKDQHALSSPDSNRRGRGSSPTASAQPTATRKLSFNFTSVEKVMFPQKGYTKGEVLDYYAAVAHLLLPHLRNRPITLERLPDGVRPGAPHFWQKRTPSYYPDWIPRVDLTSKDGTRVNYALVNDEQTLLYMV